MSNRKKIVTICILLSAGILLYILKNQQTLENGKGNEKTVVSTSPEKNQEVSVPIEDNIVNKSKRHEVSEFCPNIEPFTANDIVTKEAFAENTHFKRDGEVYRIRIFVEDGRNTSYKKLVFFKEDEDGFPQIIKEKELINPTQEQIDALLAKSEIIHNESDVSIELKDGRVFNYSQVNGEITKVLDGNSGYSCR